jgi:tryptophan synthase beta chain
MFEKIYHNVKIHSVSLVSYDQSMLTQAEALGSRETQTTSVPASTAIRSRGRYGSYGGQYAPETLMEALEELEREWRAAIRDWRYLDDLAQHRRTFIGRPTPLYYAANLTRHYGGAKIYLKREDLCHTGAFKLNDALAQTLLVQRMGKRRIIAGAGAGQHGVATASACARFGLECTVYMGSEDMRRQELDVRRMRLLGAEVREVDRGARTLNAISEAMRDWISTVHTSHLIIGSSVGPHPFPEMVRWNQSVIGQEAMAQFLDASGRLPDAVVACVGGGSNAIGLFSTFIGQPGVTLIGVEAAGRGIASGAHAASLNGGRPGVLHGSFSYLLYDEDGQVMETHSIAAGLAYPGVGPEHSHLFESGAATYTAATDDEAVEAFRLCTRLEGIMPALEAAHALHHAGVVAQRLGSEATILVGLSGRGEKDMDSVENHR